MELRKQEYQCAACGQIVYRYPSPATVDPAFIFCSKWCSAVRLGKRVTIQCPICDAPTQRIAATRIRIVNPCCSKTCTDVWRKERQQHTRTDGKVCCRCFCGKTVWRFPDEATDGVYCSARCRGFVYQSEVCHVGFYRGPNWGEQRDAARKRDNYTCQRCGVREHQLKRALSVHHIKPFRTFGYIPGQNNSYLIANDLRNLVSLCGSCHNRIEAGTLIL